MELRGGFGCPAIAEETALVGVALEGALRSLGLLESDAVGGATALASGSIFSDGILGFALSMALNWN